MVTKTTRPRARMATKAKTVSEYLAAAPPDLRAALGKLRRTIKAAAPKAAEGISYGMAAFKHNGKNLVYFAYWKEHVALYGIGSRIIDAHAAELKPYVGSKGTIQLPAEKPLPYGLVTKMVKARIAEIDETSLTPGARRAQPRTTAKSGGGHQTVDDYLVAVPENVRAALNKLRKTIKAAAPNATEGISYQVPVFKLDGKPLVGFGATTAHCTFYVMSTSDAMRARLRALKGYKLGGGSIQFPAGKALPTALVTRLVKARIAENRTRARG